MTDDEIICDLITETVILFFVMAICVFIKAPREACVCVYEWQIEEGRDH